MGRLDKYTKTKKVELSEHTIEKLKMLEDNFTVWSVSAMNISNGDVFAYQKSHHKQN